MSRKTFAALLALILGACAFRWLGLLHKPLHHDESINGWFVMQMWKDGFYRYDPGNYHGPLLFYFFQLGDVLFGDALATYRGITAFFSGLTAGLFFYLGFLRHKNWFLVGLVFLFSPAGQFFGQSAIHESIFIFFLGLLMLGLLKCLEDESCKSSFNLWFIGLGLFGTFALKETIVLFLASGLISFMIIRPSSVRIFWDKKILQMLVWVLAGLLLLYTGFLQNWHGAVDLFAAFLPWMKTGVSGSGHEKSFWFWLRLMNENEKASLVLALVSLMSFWRGSKRARFFALAAWVHFLIFSLIPYKTPWCLLSLQIPLLFASGVFLSELQVFSEKKNWILLWLVCLSLTLLDFPKILTLSWNAKIDLKHSYVYVQTEYSFRDVIEHLEKNQDLLEGEQILVGTAESWPLPWWLRKFSKLSWSSPTANCPPESKVLFLDLDSWNRIKPQFEKTHRVFQFETRQSRGPAVLVLSEDLYQQIGFP